MISTNEEIKFDTIQTTYPHSKAEIEQNSLNLIKYTHTHTPQITPQLTIYLMVKD